MARHEYLWSFFGLAWRWLSAMEGGTLMKGKYAKKSICPFCDYEILRDSVPLGKIYDLIPESIQSGGLICGGCGKVTILEIVMTHRGGYLPMPIFEFPQA